MLRQVQRCLRSHNKPHTRVDDVVPTTSEVAFQYEQKFTLLGVDIDNKLRKMDENFKERAKKIETQIFLW